MSKNRSKKNNKVTTSGSDSNRPETSEKKDKSPYVYQRDKITGTLHIQERDDLTERQKTILETMVDKKTRCVMIDGYWGTSKSFLAILAALKLMNEGKVSEMKYVVNPVEASTTSEIGLLPGNVEEKLKPYSAVLYDKLGEFLPKSEIDFLEKEQRIECIPVSFLRGRSWNSVALVIDECANLSYDELLLTISRCGSFCRIFMVGDSQNQNSIGKLSGFRRFFETFYGDTECMENGIYCFELRRKDDIVRSGFVRFVMEKVGVLKYENCVAKDEPMFLPTK